MSDCDCECKSNTMWMETLKYPKQVKEKKQKKFDADKIFDHTFKEGGKVKKAKKEKSTAKDMLYQSLNKDLKNNFKRINPF